MIGYIEGNVVSSEPQRIIVLTAQGLGYEVHVPTAHLPGKNVALFTTHIVREDAQSLFGFLTLDEKRLFEMLIDVNGIGPKSAFGLIAHLGHSGVIQAITLENANMLKEAPGVGKKSAEQIVLSLKDKVQKLAVGFSLPLGKPEVKKSSMDSSLSKLMGETLQACSELGYKESQILPVMNKLLGERDYQTAEDLLKGLLRELR
ncbi:MAG: Holliday junction branch migration protein RuvA [Bacteriovoracaceae bacterium]|nr:Holliday junction branch migration protein RuvA [Bacteriovoracaceae bacterium]